VNCGDGQGQPYGIMIIRVLPPALSHLRPVPAQILDQQVDLLILVK
jgi:hypothetical protein